MIFDILTIFPHLLTSPLEEGIIRRARQRRQIEVHLVDIRDFALDTHHTTDDRPFGGGEGMVMKPEPLTAAVESCRKEESRVILLSPQGQSYTQQKAQELSSERHLVLVCGRYEGVDARFLQNSVDEELSIGDFILTGGELAALVVVDSITRLLPGVLGCSDSRDRETFSRGLLKHPQYTRPQEFRGQTVPAELLSGNHEKIEMYRFLQSVRSTLEKRPELLQNVDFSMAEKHLLGRYGLLKKIEQFGRTVKEDV